MIKMKKVNTIAEHREQMRLHDEAAHNCRLMVSRFRGAPIAHEYRERMTKHNSCSSRHYTAIKELEKKQK